jgi:phospholipid/cholesterol/gamma-HCH transport system substrate-binding protein
VRLLLTIDVGTPIRADTVAKLATQGITGLAHVELSGGSAEAPPLQPRPGERLPEITTAPSLLGRIDQAAPRLIEQLERATRLLGDATGSIAALFSEPNRTAVGAILGDLQRVSGALGSRAVPFGEGLDRLDVALQDTARAATRLPDLLDRAERAMSSIEAAGDDVSGAAAHIEQMSGRIAAMMQALEAGPVSDIAQLARRSGQELQVFAQQTHPDLQQLLADLRATSAALRRVTEALEDNPSLLLFGRSLHPPGPGEEERTR